MLSLAAISFEHGSDPIFENLSLSLDSRQRQRIAIVGPNGVGKTTLLRLLAGELEPTAGSIARSSESAAYLPQEIEFPNESALTGEYLESRLENAWEEYRIDLALAEVGLDPDIIFQEIGSLSGGQRVRVGLAALLLAEPTILLLDEPTNHLDAAALAWLTNFIRDFRGSVAVVSHDRRLIADAADTIWELTETGLEVWGLRYEQFLVARAESYQRRRALWEASRREIQEIARWLQENELHPKYRFSNRVMRMKAKLARLQRAAPPEPPADPAVRFQLETKTPRGRVCRLRVEKKKFGDKTILQNVELTLHRAERLRIAGPNGAGKTTLLEILAGRDADFAGELQLGEDLRVGYLGQFGSLDPAARIFDEFVAKTGLPEPRARGMLAGFLFPREMQSQLIGDCSFGQQRRLELAIILANQPSLLILDEPTNHLDIFIREQLETFLRDLNIPIIAVSHDRYFVSKMRFDRELMLGS